MASLLSNKPVAALHATRRARPTRRMQVVAQHTAAATRPSNPADRGNVSCSSASALLPTNRFPAQAHQQEPGWFHNIISWLAEPTPADADEEWKQQFGHLLDPHEEAGARHGMYKSHLAERLSMERK